MTDEITGLITSSFGISNQTFWLIFIGCASLGITLAVSLYFRSTLLSMMIMPMPFVFGIAFGYIPLWIGFMLPMPFLLSLLSLSSISQSDVVESENLKPYWEEQGDKLKNAYRSKFGGDNPAFDQEVDNHVRIMINNGRGFTNTLAHDWMKRMAKFTECK